MKCPTWRKTMATVEEVKKLINEIFSDTSVSPETTQERITEILDECYMIIQALEEDHARDNE
jgi:hypothetical protein